MVPSRQCVPVYTIDEMEDRLGTYMDIDDTWILFQEPEDCSFVREDGSLIARIKRNAISPDLLQLAKDCYLQVGKMVSSNRGYASGLTVRGRSHTTFEKGQNANSGIMGYIDNTNLRRPCRLTQFSKLHFEQYNRGIPFIQRINECFSETVPEAYARQIAEAKKSSFHIPETAFSTVTVNYNFRTSVHKDSGDFRSGFGNLVVWQNGLAQDVGGYLLFPRYKLAIVVQNGDFVAMDVHEYHCNSPIHRERLSFVCYLRERMSDCDRVNTMISRMHQNGKKNADDWTKDIFTFLGEDLPVKRIIGYGPAGHEWWERHSERATLRYKNKRYSLIDHASGCTIHELGAAWQYALTLNSRHQSQEDDGSNQVQ